MLVSCEYVPMLDRSQVYYNHVLDRQLSVDGC